MKTLTKKTHIAKVREANREGLQQVCHLLQISEQQYCEYLFQQYCLFIDQKYRGFPDIIANKILYSPLFRGVFNNCAAKRDQEEFIYYAEAVTEDVTVINRYGELEIHDAIPLGGDFLIDEWQQIHSYKRLLLDDDFINQFNHVLGLIKIV